MRHRFLSTGVSFLVAVGFVVGSISAALTADQRKELKDITAEIGKANGLISKKKFDDATTALEEIEDRFNTFIKDHDLKETDPALKPVRAQLTKAKEKLGKLNNKRDLVFQKTVAPILASKCVECHSNDPKGGLKLDSFEDLEKGGRSGIVISPGNAEESLLVQRLITPDEQSRMPKNANALSEKEVAAIVVWINDGARFEGDKSASMSALVKSAAGGKGAAAPKKMEINKIEKENGTETVHFTRDILPELFDTCGRCHNDTAKRGGFSVTSFEKLWKGGDSGSVITGGSLEKSRLWRLLNGKDGDTPIMPAGNQTGITRKWYENTKTWILEGAHFDGADPKKPFPSFEERQIEAMARFSPEQWVDRRKQVSEAAWKKTFPQSNPTIHESEEFLILGDVTEDRLLQIERWATDHVSNIKQTFKVKESRVWKGKLAMFIFKERFGYEEFNSSVHKREVPREVIGHSQVTATMEDAFVALQDVGDTMSESSPGMQANVIEQITGAYFKRGGSKAPEWAVRGAGLSMAHHRLSGNPYFATLPRAAGAIMTETKIDDPAKIFDDGTFSPAEVAPIGFTLVEFLIRQSNMPQFGQFIARLQSGTSMETAIKEIYQADGKTLARAYAGTLPAGGKKGKK